MKIFFIAETAKIGSTGRKLRYHDGLGGFLQIIFVWEHPFSFFQNLPNDNAIDPCTILYHGHIDMYIYHHTYKYFWNNECRNKGTIMQKVRGQFVVNWLTWKKIAQGSSEFISEKSPTYRKSICMCVRCEGRGIPLQLFTGEVSTPPARP